LFFASLGFNLLLAAVTYVALGPVAAWAVLVLPGLVLMLDDQADVQPTAEENEPGIACVAARVRLNAEPCCALSVSAPAAKTDANALAGYVARLRALAAQYHLQLSAVRHSLTAALRTP